MVMSKRLALVTGGTRGIGLGIARALAHDGWDLALCGVRPAADVSETVSELRQKGAAVYYLPGDLSRQEERHQLVRELRTRFGAINALVNNAGRAPRLRADLLDASEDSFEEVLRTNLQGPYFLTQQLVAQMLQRRKNDTLFPASVVFVTSVSADMASPNRGEYCVSKAGLAMTVKLFAS